MHKHYGSTVDVHTPSKPDGLLDSTCFPNVFKSNDDAVMLAGEG